MFGYLTPDQVTLVRIAIIVALLLFFVGLAVVSALGAGLREHPIPDVRQILDAPFDPECPRCGPFDPECPRCGGAGVVDFYDDWLREIAHDLPCPRCGGTGVVEDVA